MAIAANDSNRDVKIELKKLKIKAHEYVYKDKFKFQLKFLVDSFRSKIFF